MKLKRVFSYGQKEMDYLCSKDKRLCEVIKRLGYIERDLDDHDIFKSLMHHIIGQQISMSAQRTIWMRLQDRYRPLTAKEIFEASEEELKSIGISYRKAAYMKGIAQAVIDETLDLESLYQKTDEEVIEILSSFKGIGTWTAEMILLFSMERPDVFSYGDLAIVRGIRMVYHHRKVTQDMFERYRRRFSPYGSVASFYFWAVSAGNIPDMKDYGR